VKFPMFFSFNESFKNPQFNPLDPDIDFKESLAAVDTREERDSLRFAGQEYQMRKSINFTNVRKEKGSGGSGRPAGPKAAPKGKGKEGGAKTKGINWANSPFAISNFNTSYAFTESDRRNINIVQDHRVMHTASLNYNYQTRPKNIAPFKNKIQNKQLALIRDFNFYYLPSKVSMRTELSYDNWQPCKCAILSIQLFHCLLLTTRRLTSKRMYDVAYDLSKGLKLDYNATAQSRIDELPGDPKTQANRDTIIAGLSSLGRPTNSTRR
jgi:hypothetical protein